MWTAEFTLAAGRSMNASPFPTSNLFPVRANGSMDALRRQLRLAH